MALQKITHPELDKVSNIKYGFFTRHGGVSTGVHNSLNFAYGKGDTNENIRKNKEIIAREFGLDSYKNFIFGHQIHSNKVFVLEDKAELNLFDKEDFTQKPNIDAIVTKEKGAIIGVKTADCVPVLFADEENGVIGAAHAGWKGARYGILANTIHEMLELGAKLENIKAVIGPCIRQESYEVDSDFVRNNFLTETKSNSKFFTESKNPGKFMFDLAGYVNEKLELAKLQNIFDLNIDTYSNEDMLFSYRRNCHQGYVDTYGAQTSCICLIE